MLLATALTPLLADAADRFERSARSTLQAELLAPLELKESKRSRFSRAMLPPQARRIRMTGRRPQTDRQGRRFIMFAVDESHAKDAAEDQWFKNAITGCVYPVSGEVLVKRGEVYYAAPMMWGKAVPTAPSHVCRPASI